MTIPIYPTTLKKSALITGVSLFTMALIAGFAYGFVYSSIYAPLDAELSSHNLRANFDLYKYGVMAWVIIAVLDVIVSIGIYSIYKSTQQKLALWSSAIRIIYTLFLLFATYQLAIPLIDNSEINNGFFYMALFAKIWSYGLITFGLHLIFLSVLCYKSSITPNIVAALLCLGGLCYILIESLKSFYPNLSNITATIESVLIAPMVISELAFTAWLLITSAKIKR
jgi:hypothetical protein